MAETTTHEKAEKRRRDAESPGPESTYDSVKRRELMTSSEKDASDVPSNILAKSSFASASGFGALASASNVFASGPSNGISATTSQTKSGSSTEERVDSTESSTPKENTETKKVLGITSGFGGFGKSSAFTTSFSANGFSSLLSSKNDDTSNFASLLDAAPKKSVFDQSGDDHVSQIEETIANGEAEHEETEEVDEQQYVAVKGLEKTVVPTGEEGETCIHTVKAKLYAIDPKNPEAGWKERGVGSLRVLQDNESRTRLVMRADAVLRVILNMPLHPSYKIEDGGESMGDKTIRLFGFEEGTGLWLAMRVGSKRSAEELKDVIRTALEASVSRQAHTTSPPARESQDTIRVRLAEPTTEPENNQSSKALSGDIEVHEPTTVVEPVDSVEAKEILSAKEIEQEKEGLEANDT